MQIMLVSFQTTLEDSNCYHREMRKLGLEEIKESVQSHLSNRWDLGLAPKPNFPAKPVFEPVAPLL